MAREQSLLGFDLGCPKCPRGVLHVERTLVITQCRACFNASVPWGAKLAEAGWTPIENFLLPYVVTHVLPHIHVSMKRTPTSQAREPIVYAPSWLALLLHYGNKMRTAHEGERLYWPRVCQRARDDVAFRESVVSTIELCHEPLAVSAMVASIAPSCLATAEELRRPTRREQKPHKSGFPR